MLVLHKIINTENEVNLHKYVEKFYNMVVYICGISHVWVAKLVDSR